MQDAEGSVNIFTFPPLNVNWTFGQTLPPFPLLPNAHLKFCCAKSQYIPEGILTCTIIIIGPAFS